MEPESEQSEHKATKLIDGRFVVDLNKRIGGGSYSSVYVCFLKGQQNVQLACKVISKSQL
jgi:hypothetical protein